MSVTLVIGQQGRVVIPAELRAELNLQPGDTLHVRISGRALLLERPADAAVELRGLVAPTAQGRSLVDELLAERREAALRE